MLIFYYYSSTLYNPDSIRVKLKFILFYQGDLCLLFLSLCIVLQCGGLRSFANIEVLRRLKHDERLSTVNFDVILNFPPVRNSSNMKQLFYIVKNARLVE